jgi:hypothetical protein
MALPPTLQEFYRHGPGPEVWEALARRAADLDATTNRILLPAHGCSTDDPIQLEAGPAFDAAGTLATGLSPFVVYFARIVSGSLLELAATAGGAAVDFGPDEGTFGMTLQFSLEPPLTQALQWATDRFLACAADKGWEEPAAGWGGDVKDRICDLVAWPQLDRRGYVAEKKDGYRERYLLAAKEICEEIPLGVDVSADPGDADAPAMGFGSSGWGEEPRGFLGQTAREPRRRAVIS